MCHSSCLIYHQTIGHWRKMTFHWGEKRTQRRAEESIIYCFATVKHTIHHFKLMHSLKVAHYRHIFYIHIFVWDLGEVARSIPFFEWSWLKGTAKTLPRGVTASLIPTSHNVFPGGLSMFLDTMNSCLGGLETPQRRHLQGL